MSKYIFEGFLHSSRPDFDALYGIKRLDFVSRTNYVAANGWTDPLTLPTTAWYDALAAAYTHPYNLLLIDHEAYPLTTQAERLAAATKFVTIYTELKARMPTFEIGFYSYPTLREFWRTIGTDADSSPGGVDYVAWQGENDDMAAMWAVVDFVAPTIYYPYNVVTDGPQLQPYVYNYFHAQIEEAKRGRTTYGNPSQLILAYVWYQRESPLQDIDLHVLDSMFHTAYTEADGLILWGGFGTAWAEFAWWWIHFKATWPFGDRTVIKPRTARM